MLMHKLFASFCNSLYIYFTLCNVSYHASDWSPCTVTCGSGKRFRSVRCKVYLPSNQMLQDLTDLECLDLPKPDEISDCEEDECDSYDPEENTVPSDGFAEGVEGGPLEVQFVWRYTGFTECSASCVGGMFWFDELFRTSEKLVSK